MNATITLGDAGLILLGLALFILLFYLILAVKNTLPSLKSLSKILQDVEVVTRTAAEGSLEAKKIVNDLSESAEIFTDAVKGNQSIVSALTSIVNCFASIKGLFNKDK